MITIKKALLTSLSLSALVTTLHAQSLEFGQPITTTILTHPAGHGLTTAPKTKEIVLMNIKFTPQQKEQTSATSVIFAGFISDVSLITDPIVI